MLLERWIPSDIEQRLLTLKHALDGYDTVAVRYELNGYYVQIMQTSFRIGICVRPAMNRPKITAPSVDEQKEMVAETIDRFFNEASNIIAVSTKNVQRTSFGLAGKPLMFDKSPIRGSFMRWWGTVYWWTDGEAVAFITGKPTPSTEPIEVKDWF